MTGDNWMKHFIGRLLRISHLQWLYRNFTLHDKTRGYLRLQRQKEALKEVDRLLDTNPDDIPKESQYLIGLDFTSLYSASFEKQSYWVLAMKATRRAGRQANHQAKSKGASHRRRQAKSCNQRAVYDFSRDLALMNHELRLGPQPHRRPHHSSSDTLNPLNKRRKPDWKRQGNTYLHAYVLSCIPTCYRITPMRQPSAANKATMLYGQHRAFQKTITFTLFVLS